MEQNYVTVTQCIRDYATCLAATGTQLPSVTETISHVAWTFCLCTVRACLLVGAVSRAKAAGPIKMLFGVWTRTVPAGTAKDTLGGGRGVNTLADPDAPDVDILNFFSLGGSSDAASGSKNCSNIFTRKHVSALSS